MAVLVPVSWGEVIDKITILEIKLERLSDAAKRVNVRRELDELGRVTPDMHPDEIRRRVAAMRFPGAPGAFLELAGVRFEAAG